MADNEKNRNFQNKRAQELSKVTQKKVYTRCQIRIKFPDDYVLQGTFGALEKISDLYAFVNSLLATP